MEHKIVSHDEWLRAREEFLAKEKAFTRAREELSRERRELPWERVEKQYVFDGARGKQTLADVFGDKSQLIIYHFMFDPEWDAGCKSCSFWADNYDGIDVHLAHRDVTFLAVSRAPYAKIAAYRKRMGWSFEWVSSYGTTFNYDFGVSFTPEQLARGETYNYGSIEAFGEAPGLSVFSKDSSGAVFHTYSTYGRGLDMLNGAYHHLDLAPKGRDEPTTGNPQAWVRRHDEY